MILREQIILVAGVYRARISLESLALEETNALSRFGNLVVNLGGEFSSGDTDLVFSLLDNHRFFPSQFPAQEAFPVSDEDAAEKAEAWLAGIRDRILEQRDLLLLRDTSAIKDVVTDYPPGDTDD